MNAITRRRFVRHAAALPLVATALLLAQRREPATLPAPNEPLQDVYVREGDEWRKVRLYQIRSGDAFWISGQPDRVFVANGDPSLNEAGAWGITGTASEPAWAFTLEGVG